MLLATLSASLVLAAPVPKVVHKVPVARLQLLASSLQEGDPLFFALSVMNYSDERLPLRREPIRLFEDVVCEVRAHDDADFRVVRLVSDRYRGSNCRWGRRVVIDHGIEKRDALRFYLCLPLDDETDLPVGKCHLRVRFMPRQSEVVSESYEFTISRRDAKSAKAFASIHSLTYMAPEVSGFSSELASLKAVEKDLKGSAAGTVVTNRLLAGEVAEAATPTELVQALDRVEARRKDLSDFEQELLDLAVGNALLIKQKVNEAEKILERVTESSVMITQAKARLAELKTYAKQK